MMDQIVRMEFDSRYPNIRLSTVRKVWLYLSQQRNTRGYVHGSFNTLSRGIGMPRATLFRAIERLQYWGYVEQVKTHGRRACGIWRVIVPLSEQKG